MKIDRPERPKHNNMQLSDSEVAQLIVFDELIAESTETIIKTKTVKKLLKDDNGKVKLSEDNGQPIWFNKEIIKLKNKVNEVDKKKFRKAKKNYVRQLEEKYGNYTRS